MRKSLSLSSRPNSNLTDNDANVRELEQLVDKLQTVNRTLSSTLSIDIRHHLHLHFSFSAIDASLTTTASDENFL